MKPAAAANAISKVLNAVLGADRFPVRVDEVAMEYSRSRFATDPITKVRGEDLGGVEGMLAGNAARSRWLIAYNAATVAEIVPRARQLDPTVDEAKVSVAMLRLDAIWDQLFPAEQMRIFKLMVEKVIVSPDNLEVRLRANGVERVVLELQPAIERVREETAA